MLKTKGETMTNAIERADGMQQIATVLRHEQQTALELLLLGHSDIEIAKALDLRRETTWRWKHRDPAFQAALRERQATIADAAAERLRGLVDQAVSVVQRSLSSAAADPKLAMALLSALGVLDRGRALGQAQAAPAGLVEAGEVGEDVAVERVLETVEVEAGGVVRRLGTGG